jgi:hypothetical protein
LICSKARAVRKQAGDTAKAFFPADANDQRSETYSNKLKNHGVFQAFLLVPIKLPQQMAGAQYKEQFLLLQTITYPISDNWHN